MIKDMLRLRDWPIISFAFFTLGVFAAQDFGHGFAHAIGVTFMAVAVIWSVGTLARRRTERRSATAYRAAA